MLRRYFASEPTRIVASGSPRRGGSGVRDRQAGSDPRLAAARTDPELFAWSYDYVGDLAETVALIWPSSPTNAAPPGLWEVVETLNTAPKADLPLIVSRWLDASDASVRLALLKLITGRIARRRVRAVGEDRVGRDRGGRDCG